MEYVSREEILAEYDRQHKGPAGGARKIMETWPAADVVPVVRCKECVWWYKGATKDGAIDLSHCTNGILGNGENFYCSIGQRKSNP